MSTARVIYLVVMRARRSGKWETWTNYAQYDEAELAACGLVTGGAATEAQILEVGEGEPRIITLVGSQPKVGWPHGAATVKKVN
jgi:hypothetical protein